MKKLHPSVRERDVRFNLTKLKAEMRYSRSRKKGTRNTYIALGRKYRFVAPPIFSLGFHDHREALIKFVSSINFVLKTKGSTVHIDFSKTSKLYPCGTLYFRAHMEKCIELYPNRITCNYPLDDIVGQLFQHISLLEKMGLTPKYKITADNVKYWHSVDGTKADTTKFESLLKSYESELTQPMRMGLYDSMSEAVTNSAQHAYETLDIPEENQKWWMFAIKDKSIVTVAIYDGGIGIANSLKIKPELKDIIRGLLRSRRSTDRRLIQAAVGSHKTKTKLPYRGKGLPDMLTFIRDTTVGGLLIHSNSGVFMYEARHALETSKTYKMPIEGTLIQWTLPLNDEVDNE